MTPHVLHVFQSFAPGGAQVRAVQIMNHLGASFRHTVAALDGRFQAADRVARDVPIACVAVPHTPNPVVMADRFLRLMMEHKPDLLLTYNWGTIDAVSAAMLRPGMPLIHTEDGFGQDEACGQKGRRVWFRRLVLRRAVRVIAPSRTLLRVMESLWRIPARKATFIPNGVDVQRFHPAGERNSRELVVGTVGHLRPEKQQHVLIELCADLARERPVRLVVAGDGVERARLEGVARSVGFPVTFLGHQEDAAPVYREMDIFALTSSTEQMPLSVLEAMATGLPVVSTGVGDVRDMVSAENRAFIGAGLRDALRRLADEPAARWALGAANRQRAMEVYSLDRMFRAYAELYSSSR